MIRALGGVKLASRASAQALQPEQHGQLWLLIDELCRLPGHRARECQRTLALSVTEEHVRRHRQRTRCDEQHRERYGEPTESTLLALRLQSPLSLVDPLFVQFLLALGRGLQLCCQRGAFLLRLTLVAPLPDHVSEDVVAQLDALSAIPVLDADQSGADQLVEFRLREMRRHRVFTGIAVAEAVPRDELILDELCDALRKAIDTCRVVFPQYVPLRTVDQLLVEPRCAASLPRLVELTAEQAQQRGLHVQRGRIPRRAAAGVAVAAHGRSRPR